MKTQKAKQAHRCDTCGKRIPVGEIYWVQMEDTSIGGMMLTKREHSNCLNYSSEPTLPEDFHVNRSRYDKLNGTKK